MKWFLALMIRILKILEWKLDYYVLPHFLNRIETIEYVDYMCERYNSRFTDLIDRQSQEYLK